MNFPSVSIAAYTIFDALFADVAVNVTVDPDDGSLVYVALAFDAIFDGMLNPV